MKDEFAPRRVVVALDASPGSLAALDAAADLAARVEAELLGVFVEDINLIRLAELPVTRNVSLAAGTEEPLRPAEVEAHMRDLATRARQALSAAASRCRVTGSFRVARGPVVREVLAAAEKSDLLILGWTSRPLTPRERPGRTARAAARLAAGSVLLLPLVTGLHGPVVAVHDSTDGSPAVLAAGARLSGRSGQDLLVLAIGASSEAAAARAESARDWLRARGRAPRCRAIVDGLASLRDAIRSERAGLLVLSATSPFVTADGDLLDELGCALLLVR